MPLPPLKGRPQGFITNDRVGQDRAQQILELRNKIAEVLDTRRVNDQVVQATTGDTLLDMQKMSAPRTVQLYAATVGARLVIVSSDQSCNVTNTVTILPYPGCLINGASSVVWDNTQKVVTLYAVNSVVNGRIDWSAGGV